MDGNDFAVTLVCYLSEVKRKMMGKYIREAIQKQKKNRRYRGGRPKKIVDYNEIRRIYSENNSLRVTAKKYSERHGEYISRQFVSRALKGADNNECL